MLGDHRTPTPAESNVSPNQVASGFIQLGVGKFARIEIPEFERIAWSYLHGFLQRNTVLSSVLRGRKKVKLKCVKGFNRSLLEKAFEHFPKAQRVVSQTSVQVNLSAAGIKSQPAA